MERPLGKLFVGERIRAGSDERSGDPLLLSSADFTTHGVIVGMTGSGKTGLGVVLLEEALLSGIPVLAIDPKGDLGNLALTFPDLSAADFEPWVDEGSARMQKISVAELAASTAETWRNGLGSWGLGGADVAELRAAARPVIYTPGSVAGVQLNAIGRLTRPASADPAVRQDEVDSLVSGLLALVGIESDPLAGREHILTANLILRAWGAGADLDLPTLLGQILDPPIRKLGVMDLETFFPAPERQALARRLNALLASPSFAAWAEGDPLDVESMLWDEAGKPRAAIVSLAHLDEGERQFAVTLLLGRVISWMRAQTGTSQLRALIYLDEVTGLAPPVGNPPSKKPILTLLKQARAFGVGLVLATQNPVDLDYKAMGNAGTWMIGRLQTEQDKRRLIDGLRGAGGVVDVAGTERAISALSRRQFVLRTASSSELPLFASRWAMSYLAGPMTGDQITRLMSEQRAKRGLSGARLGSDRKPTATPKSTGSATATQEDESPLLPPLPEGLPIRYLHPSAPWAGIVGAAHGSTRLQPMLAARVCLLFDDTAADLHHLEEWEALVPIQGEAIDTSASIAVDFDERDFTDQIPAGARYVSPHFALTRTTLKSAQSALRDQLHSTRSLPLRVNRDLKLWSRPGETVEEFAARCRAKADEGEDASAEKIRVRLESQRARVEDALTRAEDRVRELEVQHEGRRTQELVDLGTSLLGGLLGGRGRARSLADAARRAAGDRRQVESADARLTTAQRRVTATFEELDELEHRLEDALIEIDDEWSAKALAIEPIEVRLEKTDITVTDLFLVWIPVAAP